MNLRVIVIFCTISTYSWGNRELNLEEKTWSAKWIGAPRDLQRDAFINISDIDQNVVKSYPGLKPVLYFRKAFHIDQPVKSATVYCAAKGEFRG